MARQHHRMGRQIKHTMFVRDMVCGDYSFASERHAGALLKASKYKRDLGFTKE